jgi:hypothetical protein
MKPKKGRGSCYILALAALMYGCSEYNKFEITEKPFVDNTSVELFVGEEAGDRNWIQLKSTPTNQQFTWTSLNPDIATVDQKGLVTAHQEGSTVIIVASSNDQIDVNVRVREFVPLTGFSLNMSSVTGPWLAKFQPIVTPIPDNASDVNVKWSSSDESVAIVYGNGLIKIVGTGTSTITASVADMTQQITVTCETVPEKLPRGKWTVPGYVAGTYVTPTIGQSSQHGSYPITNMFDGNSGTFWHSAYGTGFISNFPHWFIVDMHRSAIIAEVMLQRRQTSGANTFPRVTGFHLYTCPDVPVNQNDPLGGYAWENQGDFPLDPLIDAEQRIAVPNQPTARYIAVYFEPKHRYPLYTTDTFIHFAEFAVYGY